MIKFLNRSLLMEIVDIRTCRKVKVKIPITPLIREALELSLIHIKMCIRGRDKPSGRRVEIEVDYIGFEVEDKFIVGYGLDFDQKYRNLPYISFLEE